MRLVNALPILVASYGEKTAFCTPFFVFNQFFKIFPVFDFRCSLDPLYAKNRPFPLPTIESREPVTDLLASIDLLLLLLHLQAWRIPIRRYQTRPRSVPLHPVADKILAHPMAARVFPPVAEVSRSSG